MTIAYPTEGPETRTVSVPESEYEYYEYEEEYDVVTDIGKLPQTTTQVIEKVSATSETPIITTQTEVTDNQVENVLVESEFVEDISLPSLDILRIPGLTSDNTNNKVDDMAAFADLGNTVGQDYSMNDYSQDYSQGSQFEKELEQDYEEEYQEDFGKDYEEEYEEENEEDYENDYDEEYKEDIIDYATQNNVDRISVSQPQAYETQAVRSSPQWTYNQPTTYQEKTVTPVTKKWQRMHLKRTSQEALPAEPKISNPIKYVAPVKKIIPSQKPQYPKRSRDPLLKLIKSVKSKRRNWGSKYRTRSQQTYYEDNTETDTRRQEVAEVQSQPEERMDMDSSEMQEIARILQQFDFESQRS